jgi:hypothetical protein
MITSNRRLRGLLAGALALMAVTSVMPASATELEIAAPQKSFFKMADTSDAAARRKRIASRQFVRLASADDMRINAYPRSLCIGLMLGVGF